VQLSTDKKGKDSLVSVTHEAFGQLDQTENHIKCVSVLSPSCGNKILTSVQLPELEVGQPED
jgi:hypothetical protein